MKVLVKLSCNHWQYVELEDAKFGNTVTCIECKKSKTIVYIPVN